MVKAVSLMLVAVLLGLFAVAETQSSRCEVGGGCVPLYHSFTSNCITYECSRTSGLPGSGSLIAYRLTIERTRCSDASGACHENRTPGLTIRNANNEVVQDCTCWIYSEGNVTFNCP